MRKLYFINLEKRTKKIVHRILSSGDYNDLYIKVNRNNRGNSLYITVYAFGNGTRSRTAIRFSDHRTKKGINSHVGTYKIKDHVLENKINKAIKSARIKLVHTHLNSIAKPKKK